MTVLLYINAWQEEHTALSGILRQTVPGVTWETCQQPGQLGKMVCQPGKEWAAVVAAVGSPEALRALAPLRDQLSRPGLLLILPSQDEPLVALGHRLAPRFLAGGADAPKLIAQVLEQMMRKRQARVTQNGWTNLG